VQAFGRAASAGGLSRPLLNVSQLRNRLGERGKPGDQGHQCQRVIAADDGGCS
jgi:hypothetical protein